MTIDDIKRRHIEFGGKFFDKEHMRWFKSRVHSKVYEGTGGVYFVTSRLRSTYFVTSEQRRGARREYTVRHFDGGGRIYGTMAGSETMRFLHSGSAHTMARRLANIELLSEFEFHSDVWTTLPDAHHMKTALQAKRIRVKFCQRTCAYVVPKWVLSAMSIFSKGGFGDLTIEEYLNKMEAM